MAVESATTINQLDQTKPGINDLKSEGDDHIRLLKSTIKNTLPNLTGPVTATHADLNKIAGAAAGAVAGFNVATQPAADNTTLAASTAMVQSAILSASGITAALPGQAGNAGRFLRTDGANANWSGVYLPRIARTSNTQMVSADTGSLIDITSGTFTQTVAACATLGAGWFVYLRNSGTGEITLDPNASETIDGLTSFVMYPGEARLIQCDGTALRSIVVNAFYQTYTATGTFTRPPGYAAFGVDLISAGGGGSAGNPGYGGGGGGRIMLTLPASSVPSSVTATVGAGGLGQGGTSTSAGGNTSFGALVSVSGGVVAGLGVGGHGGGSVPGSLPQILGVGFNGGSGGQSGASATSAIFGGGGGGAGDAPSTFGGSSIFGAGGGGGRTVATAGQGGASGAITTGGGGAGNSPGVGAAGAAGSGMLCGAGGGGGSTTGGAGGIPGGGGGGGGTLGGAGARGELRIWGVI